MASLREDASKRKQGMSSAERSRLSRAARFGVAEGDVLLPSRAGLEAIWRAHGAELIAAYGERPTLAYAFAVAELSDDAELRQAAAAWLEWRRAEPDPRSLLDDGGAAYADWTAAEPPHLPITPDDDEGTT